MNLLESVLGGQQQQQQAQDFSQRFQQGPPNEGYSEDEARNYFQQIAPQLSPGQFQSAAQQTFERMSPQDRQLFAQYLQTQAQQQGYTVPAYSAAQPQQYQDPNELARMTSQLHQQQPGLLGQLLGGGGGGQQSGGMNPLAKVALGGIAAMAVKNLIGGKL